jgi:hypothetical protein
VCAIVTVPSIGATHASPERAEYCLSESAPPMMTQLLALRLAPAGIAVREVRPGIVRTPMTTPFAPRHDAFVADGRVPARRWGEPEDVGRAVAALAKGARPFATGGAVHVDGGLHAARLQGRAAAATRPPWRREPRRRGPRAASSRQARGTIRAPVSCSCASTSAGTNLRPWPSALASASDWWTASPTTVGIDRPSARWV